LIFWLLTAEKLHFMSEARKTKFLSGNNLKYCICLEDGEAEGAPDDEVVALGGEVHVADPVQGEHPLQVAPGQGRLAVPRDAQQILLN